MNTKLALLLLTAGGIAVVIGFIWMQTSTLPYSELELMTMEMSRERTIRAAYAARHSRGVYTAAAGCILVLVALVTALLSSKPSVSA